LAWVNTRWMVELNWGCPGCGPETSSQRYRRRCSLCLREAVTVQPPVVVRGVETVRREPMGSAASSSTTRSRVPGADRPGSSLGAER
jgi:hypothetical protein